VKTVYINRSLIERNLKVMSSNNEVVKIYNTILEVMHINSSLVCIVINLKTTLASLS